MMVGIIDFNCELLGRWSKLKTIKCIRSNQTFDQMEVFDLSTFLLTLYIYIYIYIYIYMVKFHIYIYIYIYVVKFLMRPDALDGS